MSHSGLVLAHCWPLPESLLIWGLQNAGYLILSFFSTFITWHSSIKKNLTFLLTPSVCLSSSWLRLFLFHGVIIYYYYRILMYKFTRFGNKCPLDRFLCPFDMTLLVFEHFLIFCYIFCYLFQVHFILSFLQPWN